MATFITMPVPQQGQDAIINGMAIMQPAVAQLVDRILEDRRRREEAAERRRAEANAMAANAITSLSDMASTAIGAYAKKKKQAQEDAALDMITNRLDPGSYAYDQTTKMTGTNTGTMGLLNGGGVQSYLPEMSPVTRINGVLAETAKRYPNTNIIRNVQGSVLGSVLKDQISKAFPRQMSVLDQKRIEKINAEIEATKNRSGRNDKTPSVEQQKWDMLTDEEKREAVRMAYGLKQKAGSDKQTEGRTSDPNADIKRKNLLADLELKEQRRRNLIASTQPAEKGNKQTTKNSVGNSTKEIMEISKQLDLYRDIPAEEHWYGDKPARTEILTKDGEWVPATKQQLKVRDILTKRFDELIGDQSPVNQPEPEQKVDPVMDTLVRNKVDPMQYNALDPETRKLFDDYVAAGRGDEVVAKLRKLGGFK